MNKTIIDTELTQLDNQSDITQLDNETIIDKEEISIKIDKFFYNKYEIIKQLPSSGAEADIYIVKNENHEYILKLYRYGMQPSQDMKNKLIEVSEKYPEDIVRIYEIDFDKQSNRWFEIQEYAVHGSLKNLINIDNDFVKKNLKIIIEEVTLLLKSIHNENIIHRDLKPDNILIRTIHPLDLIITDFGISSTINEDMSRKMTSKSGTKIYFSPESFSGYIGKEVDYWALGMIILEILEDGNLFSGMHEGVIANEIFTKGVEIPDNINKNYSFLLKGLLTRDPKFRWDYHQIEKWLQGEKNIPIHYNYSEAKVKNNNISNIKPYKFKNEEFYEIVDLIEIGYTEENYNSIKEHFMRGYVSVWFEHNNNYDSAIIIDKYLENSDQDLALLDIYYHFIQTEDFIFLGKKICLESLYISCSNVMLKRSSLLDKTIFKNLKSLKKAFNRYVKLKNSKISELEELSLFFQYADCIDPADTVYLLEMIQYKKLSYNFLKNNQSIAVEKGINNIYKIFHGNDYTLPQKLIDEIKNNKLAHLEDDYLTEQQINDFLNSEDFKPLKDIFNFNELNLEAIVKNEEYYYKVKWILNTFNDKDTIDKYIDIINNTDINNLGKYLGDYQVQLKLYHIYTEEKRKLSEGRLSVSNSSLIKKTKDVGLILKFDDNLEEYLKNIFLNVEANGDIILNNQKLIKKFIKKENLSSMEIKDLYDLSVRSNKFNNKMKLIGNFKLLILILTPIVIYNAAWYYGVIMSFVFTNILASYFGINKNKKSNTDFSRY
ncbi:protein kinase [Aliarcobacter cryaerophilus]|uniref:protein kinase domain-containing protein n=1 Tax=Aliarcobacter cryaerophilus TaxID=28198 RepID=UPI0021B4438C|nr:protein kinase [Aliarcobacter cryaerophilus]MCT7494319.1 protein kinase [Aliarcobacter cryaerophilus]